MEFDKSRVYTALNADELKVGNKVIVADDLKSLRKLVESEYYEKYVEKIEVIRDESYGLRFFTSAAYNLAYLVLEAKEEKKLKWTDLKIGDVIKNSEGTHTYMVIGIDNREERGGKSNSHILINDTWLDDDDLEYWEKVE